MLKIFWRLGLARLPKAAALLFTKGAADAFVIGWSQVEDKAHFPYRTLCGAALGTLLGWAISRVLPARR